MLLAERLLQRWRAADPWLSMAAATVVLTVASRPEDFRDGVGAFIGAGMIILFIGVFGVPIVCDILVSLIRRDVRDMVGRDDADELVDFVRVSRVVIVLLVVLLWGWTPSSLGSDDPGDRSSSPAVGQSVGQSWGKTAPGEPPWGNTAPLLEREKPRRMQGFIG